MKEFQFVDGERDVGEPLGAGPVALSIVGTVVIFLAVAGVGSLLANRIALSEAKEESTVTAVVAARVALAPFLVDGVLERDPGALKPLDAAARRLIDEGHALHIKIWSSSERVLWADTDAAGLTFDLEADEAQLFGTNDFTYSIGLLDKPENEFDGGSNQRVLEVYLGTRTAPSNTPVLVETYYPYSLVRDRAASIRNRFLPALIGGLALLAASQIPLTLALARRLDRYQRDREHLLQDLISSRDVERQRIAAQVHDGALQDLIGVSFELSAVAAAAPPDMYPKLYEIGNDTRRTIRTLRSLLNSIYPFVAPSEGWVIGLSDLTDTLRARGVCLDLDVPDYELTLAQQDLVLRTAREALRNALFHSRCRRIVVRLIRTDECVQLSIRDDGCGFSSDTVVRQRRAGHLGLQLIGDLADEAGAVLTIESDLDTGTEVRLDLFETEPQHA